MVDKRILNKREELLGKEFETKQYGKCFIIDYQGQKDITVMFYDPVCVTKCSIGNLKEGRVANHAYKHKYPTVYGVGIIGEGVYSPDTCCFVPHIINCITISCKKVRGNLPVGVHKHMKCNKYSVNFKSEVYLGGFNTPEEAFQVYKSLKEAYIKDIAEVYLNKIDSKVYDKLTSWEVSIDD